MRLFNRLMSEPVLIASLVEAVLGLLLAFGVNLTTEQTAAILVTTGAILAVLTRAVVTPTRKLEGVAIVAPPVAATDRGDGPVEPDYGITGPEDDPRYQGKHRRDISW